MQSDVIKLGWLSGDGPAASIVLSSRVRVARNLNDDPFPHMLDAKARRQVLSKIVEAVKTEQSLQILELLEFEKLSALDQQVLLENHLVSPFFMQDASGRGLLLDSASTICIMINEEDHLRLQCILSGLDLEQGWSILDHMDDAFESKLPYAFHEQWGYLQACPTNLGTGLRASTLLHLPALVFLQIMGNLVHSLNQMGLVVRGFYGEGTEAQGHFFQVSNAFSLGPTEDDIVSRMASVTGQIMNQELEARERLKKESGKLIEDRVWRAFSVLKSSRIMNSMEAIDHLSMLRLGVQLGMLPPVPINILNELIVMTRPANLQKKFGMEKDGSQRDIMRADYLRSRLKEYA